VEVNLNNLPTTIAELASLRKSARTRSLNDEVDDINTRLWEDPGYRRWFEALWPSDTIEGTFHDDEHEAARMVREYAQGNQFPIAATAKIASITRSLGVVHRRFTGMSRRERQQSVGGEPVHMRQEAAD
jgi:hypothetical protein